MRTTDWKYDFSSLPDWSRYRNGWTFDEFYHAPQNDLLCCIYCINEVSPCNCVGLLAILKNQNDPRLVLNVTNFFFTLNFSASNDGKLLFLQPELYDRNANKPKCPVLLLDVERNAFAYVETENVNPCYTVVEKGDGVFRVEADASQRSDWDKRLAALCRTEIRPNDLHWHNMKKLPSLPKLLF